MGPTKKLGRPRKTWKEDVWVEAAKIEIMWDDRDLKVLAIYRNS